MRHLLPGRQLLRLSVSFLLYGAVSVPAFAQAPDLTAEVEAFLQVPAVAGREEAARDFVRQRLPGQHVEQDAAGNLVLTLGTGTPRRLVACPLGEPGLIVSRITPEGYLRVVPIGASKAGALWAQSFEGNVVVIGGARGWVPGGVVQRSLHLFQGAQTPERSPFSLDEAWIDVGAESAAEVEALGIRMLDPVALIRRPVRLAGGRIAGPSARLKAACVAAIGAARALATQQPKGTVVFAWTAGDFVNGIGLDFLLRSRGPFDQVLRLSPGFGQTGDDKAAKPGLDLAARYPETPVETVSLAEVGQLRDQILAAAGRSGIAQPAAPPLPPPPAVVEPAGHADSTPVLAALINRAGVSGAEGPVREEVLHRLPAWAKPAVDAQGNVVLTVGQGKEHVLFVAHLDEVGFRVAEVLPDGRLRLENRGGVLRTAWEAQAALVHGDRGPVPAVFEPRADWRTAEKAATPEPLTVWTGAASPAEIAALGIHTGSTVTMPKQMFRIGPHRALGRGFDDRAGCAALVLALAQIDPAKLTKRITFAWDVEEELGLNGSTELAKRLTDFTEVHAIDTFVSSDSPRESDRFAFAPLGHGPVLRAMDNESIAPRELIERFQGLAARAGVPVQVGFTGGATDGMPFLASGVTMLPFSWPGRSSHSPVEVADLRDVENLARLIVAVATQ
jgi:putative aminopeptidase FrvX